MCGIGGVGSVISKVEKDRDRNRDRERERETESVDKEIDRKLKEWKVGRMKNERSEEYKYELVNSV